MLTQTLQQKNLIKRTHYDETKNSIVYNINKMNILECQQDSPIIPSKHYSVFLEKKTL